MKRAEATLDASRGNSHKRKEQYQRLRRRLKKSGDPVKAQMAVVMATFAAGLFVGEGVAEEVIDNLDLERWFRLPKGHERRIHGHKHAGVRLVQEGATLMPTLDAHKGRDYPFAPDDLLDFRAAQPPKQEVDALARRNVMRQARSKKLRPSLLADLERRYLDSFS